MTHFLLASKNLKISLSVKNLSLSEFSENREEKIEKRKGKETGCERKSLYSLSQARTGHQRGMGGWTRERETQELQTVVPSTHTSTLGAARPSRRPSRLRLYLRAFLLPSRIALHPWAVVACGQDLVNDVAPRGGGFVLPRREVR